MIFSKLCASLRRRNTP